MPGEICVFESDRKTRNEGVVGLFAINPERQNFKLKVEDAEINDEICTYRLAGFDKLALPMMAKNTFSFRFYCTK